MDLLVNLRGEIVIATTTGVKMKDNCLRVVCALTVGFTVLVGNAQEKGKASPIPWQPPFETISPSSANRQLVLIAITNDDPFPRTGRALSRRDDNAKPTRLPTWCDPVLAHAYRKALQERPDLREILQLQSIRAGLPRELTGGVDRNTPSRAIVAICDGNYRLLAIAVGVPDANDLLGLIEDAEETRSLRQLHVDDSKQLVTELANRSKERLARLWKSALDEMLVAFDGDVGKLDELKSDWSSQIQLLGETFEPSYVGDVKLRFGLGDATDRTRLVVLEQHLQTREPWALCMIPFIAGIDFHDSWQHIPELIWGHQPITSTEDEDLLEWFDTQIETESIVIALRPPMNMSRTPWPPVTEKGARRGVGWAEVHAEAVKLPYRTIDLQQLASLLRARELGSVDVMRPTFTRYLYFQPEKRQPTEIHEGDPPGRFSGLLKRSKSRLGE